MPTYKWPTSKVRHSVPYAKYIKDKGQFLWPGSTTPHSVAYDPKYRGIAPKPAAPVAPKPAVAPVARPAAAAPAAPRTAITQPTLGPQSLATIAGARGTYENTIATGNRQLRDLAFAYGGAPSVQQFGYSVPDPRSVGIDTSSQLAATENDPNSAVATIGRNLTEGIRTSGEQHGTTNTFLSGMRLRDENLLTEDATRQRAKAGTDYASAVQDIIDATQGARTGRNTAIKGALADDTIAAQARAAAQQAPAPPLGAMGARGIQDGSYHLNAAKQLGVLGNKDWHLPAGTTIKVQNGNVVGAVLKNGQTVPIDSFLKAYQAKHPTTTAKPATSKKPTTKQTVFYWPGSKTPHSKPFDKAPPKAKKEFTAAHPTAVAKHETKKKAKKK